MCCRRLLSLLAVGLSLCCSLASAASEDDLFAPPLSAEQSESSMEERTFFTSNGQYFLALNTTYLLFYVALFGIGLIGALALASLFSPSEDTGYGYGGGHGGSGYNRHGHQGGYHQQHGYRQRRSYDEGTKWSKGRWRLSAR